MDVIKINLKGTACEDMYLFDWLMNRVMARVLVNRTINSTTTLNSRKFLTSPTTTESRRTFIHRTSLKLSWSYSGKRESGNVHTGQQMVVVVVMMNCGPSCLVIVGHKQVD
jgi:hypothetical protein